MWVFQWYTSIHHDINVCQYKLNTVCGSNKYVVVPKLWLPLSFNLQYNGNVYIINGNCKLLFKLYSDF